MLAVSAARHFFHESGAEWDTSGGVVGMIWNSG
jgi:hypothetical protein